ncbi:hypothetical protein [Parasphingorhabdus sp.]|uniref:hypothetical protein n=1 Tax=Parasphingorhabdus sp. TaxID=2709688 RepID=UPI003593D793
MKNIARAVLGGFAVASIVLPTGMAEAAESIAETAKDWPSADTPVLEIGAGGYTLSFPAPEWIDRAKSFVDEIDSNNVKADWFTSGAISGPRTNWHSWLSVQNVDFNHWYFLSQHSSDDLDGPCKTLDLPVQGDNERALRLCQSRGAVAGTIFYGIQIPSDDRVIVAAYKIATQPFVLADESTWPMSRDDLIAMADRIDGLIAIRTDN